MELPICISCSLLGTPPPTLWATVAPICHGAPHLYLLQFVRYSSSHIVGSCCHHKPWSSPSVSAAVCKVLLLPHCGQLLSPYAMELPICICCSLLGTPPTTLWAAVVTICHGAPHMYLLQFVRYSSSHIVGSCCHHKPWSSPSVSAAVC